MVREYESPMSNLRMPKIEHRIPRSAQAGFGLHDRVSNDSSHRESVSMRKQTDSRGVGGEVNSPLDSGAVSAWCES